MIINHKVMNCKEFEEEHFVPGSIATFKYDGVRGFYYPGSKVLYSRDAKVLYGFDLIIEELERLNFQHTLDMELMLPGYDDWNKMAGAIRNHDYKGNPKAILLDIPSINDFHINRLLFMPPESFIFSNPRSVIVQTVERLNAFYEYALRSSMEGIVIKTAHHKYRNTRSWDWMRKVPIRSVDCKCIGVYEGKGKMEGMAGGIYVDFNGMKCKVGTMKGMDYTDREDLWWNKDDYIGKTAEIHYKELQPSGKPRQPRFKGWRYDK